VSEFKDKELEKDQTSYFVIDTSKYKEGAKVEWEVCTRGLIDEFSEWSVVRTFDVYAKPWLDLYVTNKFQIMEDGTIKLLDPDGGTMSVLDSFPFYVKATPGPSTQTPIAYSLSIIANSTYETVDELGNNKTVAAGEKVYSKFFDISTPLLIEFSAGNIDLENEISYTISCTVSMSSGLTGEASTNFEVSWLEERFVPNAEIMIDYDTYSASIRPYCDERVMSYKKAIYSEGVYVVTDEIIDEATLMSFDKVYTAEGHEVLMGTHPVRNTDFYCYANVDGAGNPLDKPRCRSVVVLDGKFYGIADIDISDVVKVYSTTGEEVLLGLTGDNTVITYCLCEDRPLVKDVTLSVYRREFDGGFTEIAKGLSNVDNTFVTDPHPALDYARYRIVATTIDTGAVGYYDLPAHHVGGKEVVIQWAEEWSSFDSWSEDPMAEPPWTGSLLKLPYNIDVADTNSPDVSHVKYIGRKRPVSYYGTQLGETSTWNVEIDKNDEETIYALRRLSQWMGDVYVREPSGTGYWANIKVTFSQKHLAVTIPVTFDITRVEGGI
jgi:hypothetical protein